jgi:hypothetical protein
VVLVVVIREEPQELCHVHVFGVILVVRLVLLSLVDLKPVVGVVQAAGEPLSVIQEMLVEQHSKAAQAVVLVAA